MDALQLKYRLQSRKNNFKFLSNPPKLSINKYVLYLMYSILPYLLNKFNIIKIDSQTTTKKSGIHKCT